MSDNYKDGEKQKPVSGTKVGSFINNIVVDGVNYSIQASSLGVIDKLSIGSDNPNITFINKSNNQGGTSTVSVDSYNCINIDSDGIITNTKEIVLINDENECNIEFIGNELEEGGSFVATNINLISGCVNNSGITIYTDKNSGNIAKDLTELYFKGDIYKPILSYTDKINDVTVNGVAANGTYYVKYGEAIFKIIAKNGQLDDYNTKNNYYYNRICNINNTIKITINNSYSSISDYLIKDSGTLPVPVVTEDKGASLSEGFYLVSDSGSNSKGENAIIFVDKNSNIATFSLYFNDQNTIVDCCYIDINSTFEKLYGVYYNSTKESYENFEVSADSIFIDYEKNFTIHDPSTPELYDEINKGDVIPSRVKSCNLDDIITLVNYMKNNSLGPWEKKN